MHYTARCRLRQWFYAFSFLLILFSVLPPLAQAQTETVTSRVFLPTIQINSAQNVTNSPAQPALNSVPDANWVQAAVVNNNPPVAPISIIAFPQRDFVSASGYTEGDQVVVKVIHSALYGGGIISTDPANPIAIGADGLVEVNHPGGACWFGATPDIRPGDVVQIDIVGGPRAGTRTDATTVANVTAKRPVQTGPAGVAIHGTAQDAAGNPLPIDQLEQRLVSASNLFALNGRRTLRADSAGVQDGLLGYDTADNPTGTKWTALYTNLSAEDVALALAAESRVLWLGADPATGVEATIYEVGAGVVGGPAAPCTAPLEVLPPPPGSEAIPPSVPQNVAASTNGTPNTVTLTWDAATDNVGVTSYGVYRNGIALANVQNADGSAPAPTSYVDHNVPPGTYEYTIDAADEVGNRSARSTPPVTIVTVGQVAQNVPANEPPANGRAILTFPSRDFISAEGYADDEQVTVQIIRNGFVVASVAGAIPTGGLVEVNHPGGYCWTGTTPELRVGDIVRAITFGPESNTTPRSIDQVTVSNVTAQKAVQTGPGTVQIYGTAQAADGSPLPIAQLEQRLVAASADPFNLNGKRTLRAPGEGTLSYDTVNNATGTKWTATYTGLDQHDIDLALAVESRILWLGRDPLAGIEITLFEVGLLDPPGPSPAFCTAPLEPADVTTPSAPSNLTAVPSGTNNVQLNWAAATDDWYVYGYLISRNGQPLRYVSGTTLSYLDVAVPAGLHTYTVQAFDSASPRGAGATITAQLLAGQGQRYGNLSAASNSVSLTQPDVLAPSIPANLVALAGVGSVTLSWTASTDDVGVVSYGIYRGETKIADVPTPGYIDTGLAIGQYSYSVDAVDAAGNRSALTPAVIANVTQEADTQAPTTPTGVAADTRDLYTSATAPALGAHDVHLRWNASTDNVGVTGYRLYRDKVEIAVVNGSTLSYTDLNLAAGTYGYSVQSFDAAGNTLEPTEPVLAAVVNDPPLAPHMIIPFSQRDFVSSDVYQNADGPLTVQLIRNGAVVATSEPILPDPATGLVEVNHPGVSPAGVVPGIGGGCWAGVTPDIRAGDILRYTNAAGIPEQTTAANLFAHQVVQISPNSVQFRGFAMDAAGQPLPIGQLEGRLIAASTILFDANGSRALRTGAGLEGTLVYDAPGSVFWTATFANLSAADVTRALASEVRLLWLGRVPLAAAEATIFENGVEGGPAAGFCNAVAEARPNATLSATTLNFGDQPVNTTSAPRAVTLANNSGLPLTISQLVLAPGGSFAIASQTCGATLAAGASCTINVRFAPTAIGASTGMLYIIDDAFNSPAQVVDLRGAGVAPIATLSATSIDFGNQTVNVASTPRSVTLTNTGNGALAISSMTISPAGSNFTISANTCPVSPNTLAAGLNCTISIRFTPTATGLRTASLAVQSNASNGPQNVALSGTGVSVPAAPTGLVATPGNARVTLSWTASASATSYNIKRATISGGPYTTIGTATTPTFLNTGLTNGTTYFYVVSAVNAIGEGSNSAQVSARPVAPPAAPGGVSARGGTSQVTLSWSAAANATSYNIKRSTTNGGPYTTVGTATGTSFVNTGLTNNTLYFYIVTAVNAGGESGNSAQVSARPIAAPANLVATAGAAGTRRITLTWTAVAGATAYNVKRATTNGGPYTTVGANVAATTFANTGLNNGTTYFYVVTARVNTTSESANSNQASATAR